MTTKSQQPLTTSGPVGAGPTLAFLGAGKMATAITGGLIGRGVFSAHEMIAADTAEPARAAFTDATGVAAITDNAAAVDGADSIIVAVKPQDAAAALAPLADTLAGKLIISIAAGLSLTKLAAWIGHDRIIRVMPNTPAMVGKGAAVFACAAGVTDADRMLVNQIFGAVGIAMEMPEEKLDAVTGVSGSGPAYVYEFIQAMVDGAVNAGLDAEAARELVLQTAAGAIEMLLQNKGTPDELRAAVTSPGGTTAAGLQVLSDANFRALINDVITAATARSVELGRE